MSPATILPGDANVTRIFSEHMTAVDLDAISTWLRTPTPSESRPYYGDGRSFGGSEIDRSLMRTPAHGVVRSPKRPIQG